MHELSERMKIACCVNNIISDGKHISVETCKMAKADVSTLMSGYRDIEPAMAFSHILISLEDCSFSRNHQLLIIRIMLWQYCKILPMMTEHDIVQYCNFYQILKTQPSDVWGCVALGAAGVICGALCSALIE